MLEANWLDEALESLNEERVAPCPPLSPAEKTTGGQIKQAETRMNKGSGNSVPLVPPVPLENDSFEKKAADIEDAKREQRRNKVLAIFATNPDTQRAYSVDDKADPKNVIVTIALRDQCTFEILVSKDRYDPFVFLQLIERGGMQ